MNVYEVYYTWRGKKFRELVQAKDKWVAESEIIDKLEIIKVKLREGVEPESNNFDENLIDDNVDFLKGMFGMR